MYNGAEVAGGSPMSDWEWKARDDARTLAEAEAIKKDQTRLDRAQKAAAKMVEDETDRLKGLKKVAGKKVASEKEQGSGPVKFNVFQKI
jgi:hypothetical protein